MASVLVFALLSFGALVQLRVEMPGIMEEAEVVDASLAGAHKKGIDLVLQTQEEIPVNFRRYVQGVVSRRDEKILGDLFRFLRTWLSAWFVLFFLASLVPIITVRYLYKQLYADLYSSGRFKREI